MGLLASLDVENKVFLVQGKGPLIEKRKKVLSLYGAKIVHFEDREIVAEDLVKLGRPEVDNVVDGVFIMPNSMTTFEKVQDLAKECLRLRILVNVSSHPELCSFSLPSTYEDYPFQLAVTTNGMGCQLANRIKRSIVSQLPTGIGKMCQNVGHLRTLITEEIEEDDVDPLKNINEFVPEASPHDKQQKLRWLSQMVEYYPFRKLATITESDLKLYENEHQDIIEPKKQERGEISLVGSGPGSPGLLTTEALQLINSAEYILADKLVPEQILDLVPRNTPIFIARKFPGNAERAQEELMEIGLRELQNGKKVVRLKQGDPYIYGRGVEEYLFFQKHGFIPHVVPGITSALGAPLLAKIPPTHRGLADQVLICTGTAKAGKMPDPPRYSTTRTTVFLMALHRIQEISELLIEHGWDPKVPCAAIERASCPDQRVITSTLEHIPKAMAALGSMPPGLLVVGWVCTAVNKIGDPESGNESDLWTVC